MTKNTNQKTTRHSELVSESTRHCERSEAISSRLPRPNGLAMTEQTGRSMVEMLGVLAVIGVLSITGISGYTTAMNKHKANEILDAASKRAVVVSTQLQSGRTNPTLAEFGDDNTVGGATFSTEVTKQGTDKFVISFTTAPSDEVLKQMKAIAGTSGVVRAYTTAGSLVFNDDLTTTARASDNNNQGSTACGTTNTYCAGSRICLEGTGGDCSTTCSGTISACQKCDTTGAIVADTGKSCTTEDEETGTCNASAECEAVASCNPACGVAVMTDTQLVCKNGECLCPEGTYMATDSGELGCYESCGTATVNNNKWTCSNGTGIAAYTGSCKCIMYP